CLSDWSSDVCSSDLLRRLPYFAATGSSGPTGRASRQRGERRPALAGIGRALEGRAAGVAVPAEHEPRAIVDRLRGGLDDHVRGARRSALPGEPAIGRPLRRPTAAPPHARTVLTHEQAVAL